MFTPVSRPTERTELVSKSLLSYPDLSLDLEYKVEPLKEGDEAYACLLADATRRAFESNASTRGLQSFSKNSLAPIGGGEGADLKKKSTNEAVLLANLKEVVSQLIETKSVDVADFPSSLQADGKTSEKSLGNGGDNNDVFNIHLLGENKDNILARTDGDDDLFRAGKGNRRVGLSEFDTPADSALKQNVFDLSSVFNPGSLEDVELFGLPDSDDETQVEIPDPLRSESCSKAGASGNTGDSAKTGLDAELDAVLGYSYNTWDDEGSTNTARWRSMKEVKSTSNDVWASDDKLDVSDFAQLVPDMAIEYPFSLDVFQKRAIYRLERDESVFVAAHTSAGKTVVAEYAIALAMQRKTKVIYTSPIKTLSNQKFRDFSERFGDVGIITGDISINPSASCLIMTTEILRSMLYKGADLIRDLSFVIFDECHWLNDPERGVVWEESIILLPSAVNIVMLSATVPNAMEFARWVGRTKQKPVYVVYTTKRPVPLSHQLFVKGTVYPLFESSQGRFLEANYRRALAHHKESTKNANVRFGGGRNHTWMPIIKYLQKRSLDPAIFFCFSKKKCNEAADQLHTQDLTAGATDKNQIHLFYQSAIARLSSSDRNVPQIARHREMLKRGIGVHHAGVLPIIKEITEVLFQQGMIRVLFATETFAMGVNMPARTVVFTAIHKYDSQGHRLLEPGEYIQMAGRAGRRGLDDVGTVLLFPAAADFPNESDVKAVLNGMPRPLRSQFRLTYNTILNLLRIDELRVEDLMARSFSEAPAGRTSGVAEKLLERGTRTLHAIQSGSVELERYRGVHQLASRIDSLSKEIGSMLGASTKNATQSAISAGRIVLIRGRDNTLRLGVIVKAPFAGRSKGALSLKSPSFKTSCTSREPRSGKAPDAIVKVLVLHGGPAVSSERTPYFEYARGKVSQNGVGDEYNASGLIVEVQDVQLGDLLGLSSLKVAVDERGLVPIRGVPNAIALASTAEKLRDIAVERSNWTSLPHLDPRRDLGLNDLDVYELWEERKQCVHIMNETVLDLISNGAIYDLKDGFKRLSDERTLEHKLDMLHIATSDESLQLMPDYKQRIGVLRKLGYVDGTSVRLKGRAACEVNTCESIILTELIFEKVLQNLNAVDLASLLSVLVFQENVGGDETSYTQIERLREESLDLYDSCHAMLSVLSSLGTAQSECGLPVSSYEYARSNANFGFIAGVRGWASGKTFTEVCEDCEGDIAEGTIVRTIVRLCELLRETKNVGRCIGDPDLQAKAEGAIGLVRRDVIFAASLYVQ